MFSRAMYLPDVELGPVGKGKNADVLALIDAGVVNIPEFGALVFRVPLDEFVAKRIHALFGSRLLLIAPGAAKSRVVSAGRQTIQQRSRLQQAAAFLSAQPERIRAIVTGLVVGVNDQFRADRRYEPIAELDHFTKLIRRIDVQQREGNSAGEEGFLGQPHHHGGVLPDRIQHHGFLKLSRYFANDVNALSFEQVQMIH